MLHVHVRDPKTGQGSTNFDEYNYFIGRLRQAVSFLPFFALKELEHVLGEGRLRALFWKRLAPGAEMARES